MEQGGKRSGHFFKVAGFKVFALFVIFLICFFFRNNLVVENAKEANALQRHNDFSRRLGESSLKGPMNDNSANVPTSGKKGKNYFQRKDENYDKVVKELNEKFRNNYQHSESQNGE